MLTGKQRAYLKKLAIDLEPSVFIGKNELTENIIKEMDNYLEAHELVKVKLQESVEMSPKDTANEAAEKLGAEYVQAIGRKFVLYRPSQSNKQIKEITMGLFSKKQELTQDDKKMLLDILTYDKLKWDSLFPFPNFGIDAAMSKLNEEKDFNSSDVETCQNAIKRYIADHKGSDEAKLAKQIGKKL